MADISFPTTPTNGQTYTFNNVTYQYNSARNKWSVIPRTEYVAASSITLGSAEITSDNGVIVLPEGSKVGSIVLSKGGATQYANTSLLPTSNLSAGEFAFVGNTLFITNGTGWYSVGVTNQSPTLSLSTSSISLGASGNTINFTFTASDPDGPTPTVTMATTANSAQANVTLYTSNNTVTVENLSAENYSANIVITATDGINQTFGTVTLTVGYLSELWDETLLSVGTSSTNSLDNSTFIDRSTNAHTVTTGGSPVQTAFHPYLDNWSVEFDGTGDYLDVGSSNDAVSFGTGDFTIECWINPKTISSEDGLLTGVGWVLYFYPNSNLQWGRKSPQTPANLGATSSAVNTNEWTHVEVTRSSGTVRMFLNGTLNATITDTADYSNSGFLRIGRSHSNIDFDGSISNVRIIKGTALHTASFTPPSEKLTAVSGTSVLTCQSNRFIDNSTNSYAITIGGNPKVSAFNPFGQESEYASGGNRGSYYATNNGFLSIDGSSIDFTQNWTIECWVYYDASAIGSHIVSSINAGSGVDGLYFLNASDFYITTNGSGWGMSFQADAYLKRYSWHHCALTWDGNTYTAWIDGISRSTYSSTSPVSFSSQAIGVGATSSGTGNFGGYISDFNITTGTAKYTTTFTPPISPVGNTNADLYLPMDNAGIYDKTGNETLVNVGTGMKTANGQTKYASTSVYVQSGSSAYNSVNSITLNDFTVEFWIYTGGGDISTATYDIITIGEANINSGADFYIYQNNLRIWNNAGYLLVPAGLTTNAWHHIAFVRSGTTVTGYANGSSVGTDTMSNTLSGVIHFGGYYTNVYSRYLPVGTYIENLQISNIAKYTSNFTPPTQTQGRTYQAGS